MAGVYGSPEVGFTASWLDVEGLVIYLFLEVGWLCQKIGSVQLRTLILLDLEDLDEMDC